MATPKYHKRDIRHNNILIFKQKIKSFYFTARKNRKQNTRLLLIITYTERLFSKNNKQNNAYKFQIINLLFSSRNSATFEAKTAEFFIKNKLFFMNNQHALQP